MDPLFPTPGTRLDLVVSLFCCFPFRLPLLYKEICAVIIVPLRCYILRVNIVMCRMSQVFQ